MNANQINHTEIQNTNDIDLITLRMLIRSLRTKITELTKAHRHTYTQINKREFDRLCGLMEKYQAIHIQKSGELY